MHTLVHTRGSSTSDWRVEVRYKVYLMVHVIDGGESLGSVVQLPFPHRSELVLRPIPLVVPGSTLLILSSEVYRQDGLRMSHSL